MTTYASFVADLLALDVAGVARVYTHPPASLATADLPALFPMPLSGESGPAAFGGSDRARALRGDVCIALAPVMQDTPDANYAAQVALLDALDAALQALDQAANYQVRWTLAARLLTLGNTQYHGLVASVTATE